MPKVWDVSYQERMECMKKRDKSLLNFIATTLLLIALIGIIIGISSRAPSTFLEYSPPILVHEGLPEPNIPLIAVSGILVVVAVAIIYYIKKRDAP
jgi:hypothetical protein